jgi:hypothetical protein
MAEVYRARDTRLGRDIALKVVNEALAGDPELMRRFEQEARLAGSLNHPNLVAVYDVGIHEGAPYFITELLKGESLRQRLAHGRIPVNTALEWGAQLGQGLAAAHAQGIVHRDVKPENVFVTSDGHVKLLDFGIAKLVEAKRAEGTRGLLDETVTPAGDSTRTGAILGTPAYMSPEQVRGERVDARTDIFSLGAVLYEMLSGRRAFPSGLLAESGHAILHDEPAPLENVSVAIGQLVRQCLAKDPEARIQSARDLSFALKMPWADAEPQRVARAAGWSGLVRRARWVLVLLAGAGAAIGLTRLVPHAPSVLPVSERVTLRPMNFNATARFTPDGRVVFNARSAKVYEIFERQLASPAVRALGLENVDLAAVSSTNEFAVLQGEVLARVPGGGGTPQPVADSVVAADWSPSGDLAVVRHTGRRFVVEFPIGKTLFEVTEPVWLDAVRVSPRGDRLAFVRHPNFAGTGEAVVIDLGGKSQRVSRHWHRINGLAWATADEVWYSAGDVRPTTIQAMPLRGPERSVYASLNLIVLHDISADGGVLVGEGIVERDVSFMGDGAISPRALAWHERDFMARLSPDGRLALVSGWDPRSRVVAMLRKTTGAAPQILGEGLGADLSPDGRTALLVWGDVLTLAATDAERRRNIRLPDFEVGQTRFAGGTDRAISVARAKSDTGFRLHSVDLHNGAATPISGEGFDEQWLDKQSLEVSPGARWAATRMTVDGNQVPVIVPLKDGKPYTISELGADVIPAGWATDEELWLARLDGADPSSFGLIRYDVRRRIAVEKRTIGSGGTAPLLAVHITPDGKNIVFVQQRAVGHLFVVRGLGRGR